MHEIQANITRETLDHPSDTARFRTEADDVRVVDTRDNRVVFTPPPARDLTARIGRLIEFANGDVQSHPFLHPLVRAAVLHFWLAYEHPYVDGNGRTARALFYWAMLRSGYWLFEFLTISRVIHASTMRYYRSFLYSEEDENDLTYSLMYQLDATRRSLAELHKRLKEMGGTAATNEGGKACGAAQRQTTRDIGPRVATSGADLHVRLSPTITRDQLSNRTYGLARPRRSWIADRHRVVAAARVCTRP